MENYIDDNEAYYRLIHRCGCGCFHHCGSECRTDGCDCKECSCNDCIDKHIIKSNN